MYFLSPPCVLQFQAPLTVLICPVTLLLLSESTNYEVELAFCSMRLKTCKVKGPDRFVRQRDGIEVDNLADRVSGDAGASGAT
jgi:hypothetical protein